VVLKMVKLGYKLANNHSECCCTSFQRVRSEISINRDFLPIWTISRKLYKLYNKYIQLFYQSQVFWIRPN